MAASSGEKTHTKSLAHFFPHFISERKGLLSFWHETCVSASCSLRCRCLFAIFFVFEMFIAQCTMLLFIRLFVCSVWMLHSKCHCLASEWFRITHPAIVHGSGEKSFWKFNLVHLKPFIKNFHLLSHCHPHTQGAATAAIAITTQNVLFWHQTRQRHRSVRAHKTISSFCYEFFIRMEPRFSCCYCHQPHHVLCCPAVICCMLRCRFRFRFGFSSIHSPDGNDVVDGVDANERVNLNTIKISQNA